jgi:predicted PurR-regulated permease PerM
VNTPLVSQPWLQRAFVGGLLAVLLILGYQVLQTFIVPFVWAAILAFVCWTPNLWLTSWLRGRRTWAALIMTLLVTAAVIVPTGWLVLLLRTEAVTAYAAVNDYLAQGPRLPAYLFKLPFVGSWLQNYDQQLIANPGALRASMRALFNNSYGALGNVVGDVTRNLAKLFISMVSLFFVFRDGDSLAAQARAVLVRFIGPRVHGYLHAAGATVKAVLLSLVLCALAQGLLAGLGYWVAGAPAPVFAAAITGLAAMIPFAVPVVWGAIVAWLFISGHDGAAIGLLLWCLLVVSWVDNLIRPLVIGHATRVHFLLVLFGVLGGLGAFGLVGLFVGPVILAVLAAIWGEWQGTRDSTEPTV